MYGALDGSGQRVGNPIKSSLIGEFAELPGIERKCAADREYLRDLDRRKALAGRIRRVVGECRRCGDASRPEIERRLSEAGISAVFRCNDGGRLTGATFIDHRGKNVYNGSNLGKDLSANSWYALFAEQRPQERPSPETVRPRPAAPEPASTPPQRAVETPADVSEPASTLPQRAVETPVAEPQTPTPTVTPTIVPEPTTEYGDEYETEIAPPGERYIPTERGTDNHIGHDIFRGLSHQSSTYEQIDPEFRSLYKRKKKRGRKL
jgi:hypothetical protein